MSAPDYSELELRISIALDIAFGCAQVDGAHHKAWCIDQMVRALCGMDEDDEATHTDYVEWVYHYEAGGEYTWDTGVEP